MLKPKLLVKPTPTSTRLLLTYGEAEVMRAVLPPPAQVHARAAPTFCEAVSLWYQRPVCVVLCADVEGTSSGLGLCDGFGYGVSTVHYEVDLVEPGQRRRPLGSFRDLRRQLDLLRGIR
jgi:hypothetical protein